MNRLFAKSTQVAVDLGVLTLAYVAAFLLRFDWTPPSSMVQRLILSLPYVVGLEYLLLMAFGVPRFAWRYVGLRESVRILMATGASTLVLLAVRLGTAPLSSTWSAAQLALIPIGVILGNFVLAFLAVSGVRFFRRALAERLESGKHRSMAPGKQLPTLLYGAGTAGHQVAKEIAARPDLGVLALGFIDDDPLKVGTRIHGVPVLGSSDELPRIRHESGAQQVLVTMASLSGRELRRIAAVCESAGLKVKVLPGLFEIVGGQVNLSRIRSVTIEDLLRREPVVLDAEAIAQQIRERTVLVSGAGGSIGSELCRQLCRLGPPKAMVLVEQAENALFEIHRELLRDYPNIPLQPCIANIQDRQRLEDVFAEFLPQVVFHAAAHKHVPLMEVQPREAVKNNVQGTRNMADLAHAFGAQSFVMVSTDKAVNPTSVMGASKRVAELYVQALSRRSRTRFVTVRFGNVLASAGSVVPIFQDQIARGGPVTVTHPEMRRYFMTIPEASQLVLQAASMGKGGEIFILDMGEPVLIVDLAKDLITLSGLRPGEDIEITFTGLRPGEKLFEELSVNEEQVVRTRHPKVFVGHFRDEDWESLEQAIEELCKEARDPNLPRDVLKSSIQRLVPEYLPYREESAGPPPKKSAESSR